MVSWQGIATSFKTPMLARSWCTMSKTRTFPSCTGWFASLAQGMFLGVSEGAMATRHDQIWVYSDTNALVLTLFCSFREHAKLLTKGDNNAADDTELCMSYPSLLSGNLHSDLGLQMRKVRTT